MPEFSQEELELIKDLGLKIPKAKNNSIIVVKYKIIKVTTTCKLCKTVTIQYFKLTSKAEFIWVAACELSEEEANIEEITETSKVQITTCWNCRNTLMNKEKEDLVDLIIDLTINLFLPDNTIKKERKTNES